MEIYNEKYLREGDKISVEKKADCAVYRLSNAGGSGRITEYEIFEDVSVLFDDMHLESFGEGTRARMRSTLSTASRAVSRRPFPTAGGFIWERGISAFTI